MVLYLHQGNTITLLAYFPVADLPTLEEKRVKIPDVGESLRIITLESI